MFLYENTKSKKCHCNNVYNHWNLQYQFLLFKRIQFDFMELTLNHLLRYQIHPNEIPFICVVENESQGYTNAY